MLRQFKVTFDCMHGNLYLAKNANWGNPDVFNRAGLVLDPMERGQKVMTVLPSSPSESAGLASAGIITQIDGRSPSDDYDQVFLQPVGTVVRLTVQHGDKVRKVEVTLKDVT